MITTYTQTGNNAYTRKSTTCHYKNPIFSKNQSSQYLTAQHPTPTVLPIKSDGQAGATVRHLGDEYPCSRVSVNFQVFAPFCIGD